MRSSNPEFPVLLIIAVCVISSVYSLDNNEAPEKDVTEETNPPTEGANEVGDDGDTKRLIVRCRNQQLRDTRGRLVSPGYPGGPPPRICYQWSIVVNIGETLTLSFRHFNISKQQGTTCTQGVLEIGPIPHRKICLNNSTVTVPVVYESTRSLVWIRLATGPLGAEYGFILEYITDPVPKRICEPSLERCQNGKCLPADWFCNGVQECGPIDRSDEQNCRLPETVPTPIKLPGDRCGPGRFLCVSRKEQEVECFEDYQRCNGVVDCLNAEDERRCDARRLHCGGYTELQSGYIASPNYPGPYPADKTCEWNVHVPAGRIIQIRFQAFDLSPENPLSGASDYVEFRDGRGSKAKLIGHFTEQRRPPSVVETTGDWLYVKFNTDVIAGRDSIGFNFTHQIKGVCLRGQEKCVDEEDCYVDRTEKCDGIWQCRKRGWDERGCANCEMDKYSCGRGGRCYTQQEHCNGRGSCYDNRDEKNCTPEQCNSDNGTYLCDNGRCIYESWVCDGTNDCDDDSDERSCVATPSIRVVLAAVVGSLICSLLLVIALGCTLRMFTMRIQDQGAHFDTPMSRIQAELMRRAAPPSYNESMQHAMPFSAMLTNIRSVGRRLSHGAMTAELQPGAPLNVAPLFVNTGTRIETTTPSTAEDSRESAVAVDLSAGTGLGTVNNDDGDVTRLIARHGFEESAENLDEENETNLSMDRPSISSDSDVSLLELSSSSSSETSSSSFDQSQVATDDRALLLDNEVQA